MSGPDSNHIGSISWGPTFKLKKRERTKTLIKSTCKTVYSKSILPKRLDEGKNLATEKKLSSMSTIQTMNPTRKKNCVEIIF